MKNIIKKLEDLTPREIVDELNKYIIGQEKAKKAVAIALRNRIRKQKLPDAIREEIIPKNILMIGSTGIGKTEIARRLSKLTGAPFIKVEATKYTEVGYIGRDVESMIRDLMMVAVSMIKIELKEQHNEIAKFKAEEAILDLILKGMTSDNFARDKFRTKLENGELDEREIELNVKSSSQFPPMEMFSGTSFEDMNLNLGNIGNVFSNMNRKNKKVTVKRAKDILFQEELEKMIDMDHVSELAKNRVENMGIIFIDEIDKIVAKGQKNNADVSREGVQRDILPIIEGSKVNTKYGIIDTTHILFIAAGAFHMSKPSDLLPELQGRFPIKVELEELTKEDFFNILIKTENSLIKQYVELMKTEGVNLEFKEDALEEIAEFSFQLNSKMENIGARRLYTIIELIIEELSFNAQDLKGQTIPITVDYVKDRLKDIVKDEDLNKYIL